MKFQYRVDRHRVTKRFPTGEVKETEYIDTVWVDETPDGKRPLSDPTERGIIYAVPSAHLDEINIRRMRD